MARTTVDSQQSNANSGLVISWEAANADGNAVRNNGRRVALVRNNDSVSHTATQITGGTASGLAVADPPVSIPAGDTAMLGPWTGVFNQDDGTVHIDYDAVTSVEIAVVEV